MKKIALFQSDFLYLSNKEDVDKGEVDVILGTNRVDTFSESVIKLVIVFLRKTLKAIVFGEVERDNPEQDF